MLYPLSYGGGIEESAGQGLRFVHTTVWTTCRDDQNPAKIPRDVAAVHVTGRISRAQDDTNTAPP